MSALAEIRDEIDSVDRRIALLLASRLSFARGASHARKRRGDDPESRDEAREREIVENVERELERLGVDEYNVEEIYEPIFAATRGER